MSLAIQPPWFNSMLSRGSFDPFPSPSQSPPDPTQLDGTMAGDVGFDPLGLSSISGLAGADLYWMREAELKHGRVAMLAVVGVLWCDQIGSVPGMPSGTNQMKLFWEVWAEKPAIIGAGLVFIAIVESEMKVGGGVGGRLQLKKFVDE